jgi:hypothetical protein
MVSVNILNKHIILELPYGNKTLIFLLSLIDLQLKIASLLPLKFCDHFFAYKMTVLS